MVAGMLPIHEERFKIKYIHKDKTYTIQSLGFYLAIDRISFLMMDTKLFEWTIKHVHTNRYKIISNKWHVIAMGLLVTNQTQELEVVEEIHRDNHLCLGRDESMTLFSFLSAKKSPTIPLGLYFMVEPLIVDNQSYFMLFL